MFKAIVFAGMIMFSGNLFSQESGRTVPAVKVKDLKGTEVNTAQFSTHGKPVVISFWATWCKPCMNELNAIAENYEEWQEKTGFKLVAISIDDARNVAKVGPLVNSKGWEFEVFTDQNGDFKRAMNVNTVPHTFLLNDKGEIVWQHNAYAPGDEIKLMKLVEDLAAGRPIE